MQLPDFLSAVPPHRPSGGSARSYLRRPSSVSNSDGWRSPGQVRGRGAASAGQLRWPLSCLLYPDREPYLLVTSLCRGPDKVERVLTMWPPFWRTQRKPSGERPPYWKAQLPPRAFLMAAMAAQIIFCRNGSRKSGDGREGGIVQEVWEVLHRPFLRRIDLCVFQIQERSKQSELCLFQTIERSKRIKLCLFNNLKWSKRSELGLFQK